MKARQNQQQGQCKGRGRRQTERISQGRQGQEGRQQMVRVVQAVQVNRIQGKRSECQPGQNKTSPCVGKCAAYMWVSECGAGVARQSGLISDW